MGLAFRPSEGLHGSKGHSGEQQGTARKADFSLKSKSFCSSCPEV